MQPIQMIKLLVVFLLLLSWFLGGIGYITGNTLLYRYAGVVAGILLLVALLPLLALAVTIVYEKFRGR